MVHQTTAMTSQRSPSPTVAPPISPPTKDPLWWWGAPACICRHSTRTLALTLEILALALGLTQVILAQAPATTLDFPPSPPSPPPCPPPLAPPTHSPGPVAPPRVHSPSPGPAPPRGVP